MGISDVANRPNGPAEPVIDTGFDLDSALGEILAGLGPRDPAIDLAEQAVSDSAGLEDEVALLAGVPQDATVCEGMAAAALALEDYPAAVRHCQRLIAMKPDHYEAWFNLGVARHRMNQFDEAEAAYQEAFRLHPEDPRALLNLGLAREQSGNETGGREAYEGTLALDPTNDRALWNLGLISERLGAWDDAEAVFQQLTELGFENNEEVWFRLGVARYSREDWPGAAQAFERCLELRPAWREAELNQGLAMLRLGRLLEAGAVFQAVVDREPDCYEAIVGLTSVALETGAWEKALALRRRLTDSGRTLPDMTYNLGVVLERQGRMEDALRFYCEALKERPRFPEALLNLGHVLDRMGRRKEATECWNRALGLDAALASSYFGGGRS